MSSARVKKYGEVFTPENIVCKMVDLVGDAVVIPNNRVLEPACGTGNFLAHILQRRLACAETRNDYFQALANLYGIELMADNANECKKRLLNIWCASNGGKHVRAAELIIEKNIVRGNALTQMLTDENGNDTDEPIVFLEWFLEDGKVSAIEHTFKGMLNPEQNDEFQISWVKDLLGSEQEFKHGKKFQIDWDEKNHSGT